MSTAPQSARPQTAAPPLVEVVIEVPRGSIFKRDAGGHLDFVSPLPCPFNYGSVHAYIGGDGDLLDAVVLGLRVARGTHVVVRAFGAVGLIDRDIYDDKLICGPRPPTLGERRAVVRFFYFYARCKRLLNLCRGRPGRTRCEGWGDAAAAMARAQPRAGTVVRPMVPF